MMRLKAGIVKAKKELTAETQRTQRNPQRKEGRDKIPYLFFVSAISAPLR